MDIRDRAVELHFRQVPYIVQARSDSSSVKITVEEKETSLRWSGEFTVQYIEEITKKTGNFKKYPVFLKMLDTALEAQSESVFIDLLSYSDLELLKSRKRTTNSSNSSLSSSSSSNQKLQQKRYLILTYAVEFDRVHYPLPLNFEEIPDAESLQRTIMRLREENSELRRFLPDGDMDAIGLMRENESLKSQIARLEHAANLAAGPQKRSAVEIDSLISEKRTLEEENDRIRLESSQDMRQLRKANRELTEQLERLKGEMDMIITQLEAENDERKAIQDIKGKIMRLTEELEMTRKREEKMRAENKRITEDLEKLKSADVRQKARIKQLETEVEASRSRGRQRYTSPASRSNSAPNKRDINPRRSPGQRLNTPPNLSNRSRNSSRPGSDRSTRVSPGTRPNNSPGVRRNSPNTRYNPFQRNQRISPYTRERTPPQARRGSPGTRTSPGQRRTSPQVRAGNHLPDVKKRQTQLKSSGYDVSDLDAKLAKLQKLLNTAKS